MNLKQKKYDLMNTRKGLLDEAKAILMKDPLRPCHTFRCKL